jgi:hypothetical protein
MRAMLSLFITTAVLCAADDNASVEKVHQLDSVQLRALILIDAKIIIIPHQMLDVVSRDGLCLFSTLSGKEERFSLGDMTSNEDILMVVQGASDRGGNTISVYVSQNQGNQVFRVAKPGFENSSLIRALRTDIAVFKDPIVIDRSVFVAKLSDELVADESLVHSLSIRSQHGHDALTPNK